tara:strand:- start:7853 stop:8149 length:297 start_codon:yes stop_codon:yes gene_type:complete
MIDVDHKFLLAVIEELSGNALIVILNFPFKYLTMSSKLAFHFLRQHCSIENEADTCMVIGILSPHSRLAKPSRKNVLKMISRQAFFITRKTQKLSAIF